MPRPYVTVDVVGTPEGPLELHRRGATDLMITIAGRVLMTNTFTRSEEALARLACNALHGRSAPRLLIGGLGLGHTLRAALDALPADASITVVELSATVVTWCRGPASDASRDALEDPRVEVMVGDVIAHVREVATDPRRARYDAILLDLYVGPGPVPKGRVDHLYGRREVERTHHALTPGGIYAVWGEAPYPPFLRRLAAAGFSAHTHSVNAGGVRHVIFLGTSASAHTAKGRGNLGT